VKLDPTCRYLFSFSSSTLFNAPKVSVYADSATREIIVTSRSCVPSGPTTLRSTRRCESKVLFSASIVISEVIEVVEGSTSHVVFSKVLYAL